MRDRFFVFVAFLLLSVPSAFGQTTALVSGQTAQIISTDATAGKCYVGRGPSTFQRTGNATQAYITFAELWTDGRFDLSGQAVLLFTSATTGRINFKYMPSQFLALPQPVFTGYSQVYNSTIKRLSVYFNISFANCKVRITATYDGA